MNIAHAVEHIIGRKLRPINDLITIQEIDGQQKIIKWDASGVGIKQPTKSELLAAWDEAEKSAYKTKRKNAFFEQLPNGDQLDEILKQFELLESSGVALTPGMKNIMQKWRQVKIDIPKPEAKSE